MFDWWTCAEEFIKLCFVIFIYIHTIATGSENMAVILYLSLLLLVSSNSTIETIVHHYSDGHFLYPFSGELSTIFIDCLFRLFQRTWHGRRNIYHGFINIAEQNWVQYDDVWYLPMCSHWVSWDVIMDKSILFTVTLIDTANCFDLQREMSGGKTLK